MKKSILIAVLTISLFSTSFGEEGKQSVPPRARAVLVDMEKQIAAVKQRAISLLGQELVAETTKGNLETACAIKAKIDELKKELAIASDTLSGAQTPLKKRLPGKWMIWNEKGQSVFCDIDDDLNYKRMDGVTAVIKINADGKSATIAQSHGCTIKHLTWNETAGNFSGEEYRADGSLFSRVFFKRDIR